MTDMSAFRTVPQAEFKARDELLELGIAAEVPMELRWKRSSHYQKSAKPQEVPLMSGYVCVNVDPDEPLPATRFTRGRVGKIKTSEMMQLHRHNGRKINEPQEPRTGKNHGFKVGDTIHIKVGPYANLEAVVVQDRGRALIVQPRGANRTVSVSTYHLQRPPTENRIR